MSDKFVLNMIGGGFQHAFSSCGWNHPKYVVWDKTKHEGSVSVHIDCAVFEVVPDPNKINIGWFCESPYFMRPYTAQFDHPERKEQLLKFYKHIFTSDKELLKKHPELHYIQPHASTWIQNCQLYPKTKWASIIASAKNEAPGHQLRHMVVQAYGEALDVFGGGYKPIKEKEEGLADFMFSFSIENIKTDGYFTEKICDCFACGTIPIYWGDETIAQHFVEEGIVRLTDDFDPSILTKELYEAKMPFVKENFERTLNFLTTEDYIYLNYIK